MMVTFLVPECSVLEEGMEGTGALAQPSSRRTPAWPPYHRAHWGGPDVPRRAGPTPRPHRTLPALHPAPTPSLVTTSPTVLALSGGQGPSLPAQAQTLRACPRL